jgi:H+/Cl- antiporter ClcA
MRSRSKNLLKLWGVFAILAVIAVFGAWTLFEANKTGVYVWRRRIIRLEESPVAFRDHLVMLGLAVIAAGGFAAFVMWVILDNGGQETRIDRYLAKRRAESRDETVA